MKIVLSSGHGTKIRGAAGSPVPPYLDEVDEAIRVKDAVAIALRGLGVEVETYTDTVSTTQSENLDRIVDYHNSRGAHDLDVSVHFNAYETTSKPMGTEVLYVTQEALAMTVASAISDASGLINRGPKYRSDLKFLNATNEPSILLEVAFVDSSADAELYRDNFDLICNAIAGAIAGEDVDEGFEPRPPEPIDPIRPPSIEIPPPDERRVLGKGDVGADVAVLQSVLAVPADGAFGSVSAAQVEAFQRANQLTPDGVCGPATWSEVDRLVLRMATGGTDLPESIAAAVTFVANESALMFYSWPDRGRAPSGYIPGMALCYALALLDQRSWVEVMAEGAVPGDADDALAFYQKEMADLGLDVTEPGIEALRALFTLLIGLGMRESSGKYCEGRDMSASNVESDTCEAGLFQMSWNMESASDEISNLLEFYSDDPNGFLPTFALGINPTASNLDVYGSENGATYQWLAKYCPAFAVMTTAVGLRMRKDHWGPIKRKEVTLSEDAVTLLQTIEMVVGMVPRP